jgi:hypothetical protein
VIANFVLLIEPEDYVNPEGYPSTVGDRVTITWHAGNARAFDVTSHSVITDESWLPTSHVLTFGPDPACAGQGECGDQPVTNQHQHCTSDTCLFTYSHTAAWCGLPQPRRCGCPFCYPKEDQ